jgi:alkylation response protein AidB-like acyl-CoA dehydrogenase
MAEQSVSARIAAQIGCAAGFPPPRSAAMVAKQVAGAAAAQVANIAHAVHGAIGISEEFDLQLFTRRLHEWRLADGSESYWAEQLGDLRLSMSELSSLDAIRALA